MTRYPDWGHSGRHDEPDVDLRPPVPSQAAQDHSSEQQDSTDK